jgi:uncharacterized protein YlxW (UPF0749 family)
LKAEVGKLEKHIKSETKTAISLENRMKKYSEKIAKVKEFR